MPFALLGLFWIWRHKVVVLLAGGALFFMAYQVSLDAAAGECRNRLDGPVEASVDSWVPPRANCMDVTSGDSVTVGVWDVVRGWA